MKIIKITTKLMVFFVIGCGLLLQSCKTTTVVAETEKVAEQTDVDFLHKALEKGESFKLKKMTYYLDRPLVIANTNNFTLDGSGSTFIMKNKSEDVVLVEFSENIVLKNFKATHIEPEGPIGCTGSVVQVRNSNNVSIEKCDLNGSGIIGVVAYETKGLKVVDNYIYNNSNYGVLFDLDCTIEISGNKFEDNGTSGNSHVYKALNAGLSEVEKVEKGTNEAGLKMSNNTFK